MNQIPNIEKTMRRGIKLIAGRIEALHPQYFLDETTYKHDVKGTMDVVKGVMADIEETLHQQLQKARQDWLQEEIVRLEGMKKTIDYTDSRVTALDRNKYYRLKGYEQGSNKTLQTIIDRYHSELDQDKK